MAQRRTPIDTAHSPPLCTSGGREVDDARGEEAVAHSHKPSTCARPRANANANALGCTSVTYRRAYATATRQQQVYPRSLPSQ